jgi:hypothetical protein
MPKTAPFTTALSKPNRRPPSAAVAAKKETRSACTEAGSLVAREIGAGGVILRAVPAVCREPMSAFGVRARPLDTWNGGGR